MSQTQSKKEIEVIYHSVESKPEDIELALNRAFDVLFTEVLKDYQLNKKK